MNTTAEETKQEPVEVQPVGEETPKANIKDFKPEANAKIRGFNDPEFEKRAKEEVKEPEPNSQEILNSSDLDDDEPEPTGNDADYAISDDDPFAMDERIDLDADKAEPIIAEKDEISEKKGSNASLRAAVKEANAKLEAQKKEVEQVKAQKEAELEQVKRELAEARNRLAYRNPDQHPDVIAITKPWDDELNAFAKEMTLMGGDGDKLRMLAPELVQTMRAIDTSDPAGAQERRERLMEMIDENFPDDKKEVIRLISRGADTLERANQTIEQVKAKGEDFVTNEQTQAMTKFQEDYEKLESSYFNPSNELRSTDPLNPKVILRDMIDSSEVVKDKAEKIKQFVRFALLPLKPLSKGELSSMDEDAAASYQQKRLAQHQGAKQRMGGMIAEALMSHALLPGLMKRLGEQEAILKDFKESRPKPGKDDANYGEVAPKGEEKKMDIKEFEPPKKYLKF